MPDENLSTIPNKSAEKHNASFLWQYWRILLEVLVVFGFIIALLQLRLEKQQFTYAISQNPRLEYIYSEYSS